jgi:hypothetical protein
MKWSSEFFGITSNSFVEIGPCSLADNSSMTSFWFCQ